jgi:hypothetical protein
MNWRVSQRIFELTAVLAMMAGIILMWMKKDPLHYLVYTGFILLATGKLLEAININDPNFKILKVVTCFCIYLLAILNLFYQVRSLIYIMIPLALYYLLHYRWMLQQRKT